MNLPKVYEPKEYEETIYALWETSNAFAPRAEGKPYSLVLPPPNANGNLHIGHALTVALQDILARYHRMQGASVAYIPGADHAGFETWVVYEKQLESEGKSRFDFSREQIYTQVWDFVEAQRGAMELQLRQLGASLAWDSFVFTLDKKVVNTVYGTFKKLWDDDLIYRGERIVNFCTTHQTSFSDIEVVHKNDKGNIWKIAYPLLDKIGEIVVATTRPETLLGDVAIAVHPDDERYKELVGTRVQLPLLEIEIPIIADDAIDMSFGTGAVKVTPAHDPLDFEIAQRHNLPVKQIIGFDGLMTSAVPSQFQGITPLEARKRVLAALEATELLRGKTPYEHSVGHCYKCDSVIEPLLKDQWFVRVKPLVNRAINAIETGDITFHPKAKGKQLIDYFTNLRDWNISRQIPWGIPIPAFQNQADPSDWIFDERVDEPTIVVNGATYKREEDTFDTWFSSGQWPFVTTDYLDKGAFDRYYPLSVMETGFDILYQWVGRMIMLGLYCTGTVPFKDVYLHGLVLDEHGQKMSKSKGNVINPIKVADTYGSDALRMGIVANRSAGLSQSFSVDTVIAGRNFANKLWNIARYIEAATEGSANSSKAAPETIADHWVLQRIDQATAQLKELLEAYRFAEAYEVLYHVIWDDVADWYIESSKLHTNKPLLQWVLESCLKLAHPFAPFVTEAIWQSLSTTDALLIEQLWSPTPEYTPIGSGEFDQLRLLVTEIRFVCQALTTRDQTVLYQHDSLIDENKALIQFLAKVKNVTYSEQPQGLRLAVANREAWIAAEAEAVYEHQERLENRLADTRNQIAKREGRLSNQAYVSQAPAAIVEETKQELHTLRALESRLIAELDVIDADSQA